MDSQQASKAGQRAGGPAHGKADSHNRQNRSLTEFLSNLLVAECHLGPADAGAVLRFGDGGRVDVLSVYPDLLQGTEPPAWLTRAAALGRESIQTGRTTTGAWAQASDVSGRPPRQHIVCTPLRLVESATIAAVFLVNASDEATLQAVRERLDFGTAMLSLGQSWQMSPAEAPGLQRLHKGMEVLAGINRQNRFRGVAMAFCNELAAQWQCERVSLGFLKGRYVRVKAMSHTERFGRKMRLVQDIEAAMEECLDQDCEVTYPLPAEATCIARAAGELSAGHGQNTLLSLPLREDGRPVAVVTLERAAGRAFDSGEVEIIRLACDLCAPRLLNLHHYDRWIGARIAANARRGLAVVLGAQYTWTKLAVLGGLALVLFLVFARGWYKVKAPFVFEAVSQYKLAAPFSGFIKNVDVEVGDRILEGQTALAELDTAELRLQLAGARAEQAGYLKQADAAMRDGKTAEAQIAQANADKAQAEIDLLNHRISQARILSPATGTLVTGDLKRQIGAPVEVGSVLFEVAPLDSLRAELYVAEDEISDVAVGQQGFLATATYPGDRIAFVVERVNPAAEVVKNRNVFKVRAKLSESRPWMRPGMEGVAKVTIEKRPYARIWTRKVVNWIRMKLWL